MSAYIQARNLLASQDSSHSADALRIFKKGLALARESGAVLPEALNLQGVARVAALLDFPEAGDDVPRCDREVLRDPELIGAMAGARLRGELVARNGDIEFASVLYGHLDEYHPPWGSGPDRQMRDDGDALVRHHGNANAWMSEGSSMSRDDRVAYALGRLARTAT